MIDSLSSSLLLCLEVCITNISLVVEMCITLLLWYIV